MKAKTIIVLFVALAMIGWTAGVTAKDLVERPLRLQLSGTETASLVTGYVETQGWGECAHLGRFQLRAEGFVDWITGDSFGSGIITAANGDQVFFESTQSGGAYIITFTGGTGRFHGVTGTVIPTLTSIPVITVDLATMTATITSTSMAVGTITY